MYNFDSTTDSILKQQTTINPFGSFQNREKTIAAIRMIAPPKRVGRKNKFPRLEMLRKCLKFASASSVATALDYFIYLGVLRWLIPVEANVVSSVFGFLVNFKFQKRFVFKSNRTAHSTFSYAVLLAIISIGISTCALWALNQIPFFLSRQYLTKLLVSSTMFLFNFLSRSFAFGDFH